MKKSIYIVTFLAVQFSFSQHQKADSLLNACLTKSKSVGMVAGFSKEGERYISSAGYANLNLEEKMTNETIVRIASVSKLFTAVAVMQLVEEDKVTLEDLISKYISVPSHMQKITIRQLLDHSSGIRAYRSNKERENKKQYSSLKEASSIFIDDDLLQTPGKEFSYTTYGYTMLGILIEEVSGMSYESYLNQKIFSPAGMKNTGIERHSVLPEGISEVYHKNSKGKIQNPDRINLSDRIPGGGINSTVSDILALGEALLTGQLISNASFTEMTTDSGLKKEGNPYGLGLYLYGMNPSFGNVVGHSGTQNGASVQLMLLPDIGATIFTASNTSRVWEDVFYLNVQYFKLASDL